MWSVPLIAVVAVIGALAAFVVLAPNGAQAHDEGPGIAAHQPSPPVTGIDVTTPSIANGGRSSLQVSWNAPVTTGANAPTMYRVDISRDTDVWMNVIGGEGTNTTLTESMATSNCTSSDEGNRCYTAPSLKANTLYHFRVFAMNQHGTSPISVVETIGSGKTLRIDPPAKATGLDATDYYEDKIVVSWDEVTDTGGADVLWYCLGVASSPSGPFIDLANTTNDENIADCLEAEEAGDSDDINIFVLLGLIDAGGNNQAGAYVSQTVAIAAEDKNGDPVTSFTHDGLGGGNHDDDEDSPDLAEEIELRYRLYAVTDQDGKADTPDDRKIARAASETATGRTVRSSDKPDPLFESPPAVGNLRAVVYTTDADLPVVIDGDNEGAAVVANQGLHFFWTHPDGYDPDYNDDDAEDATKVPNWYVQVQRRVPTDEDHDDYAGWQFVTGTIPAINAELATDYGAPQFTVDFTATDNADDNPVPEARIYDAPVLWGPSKDINRTYRVRYVNPGKDDNDQTDDHDNTITTDDVAGAWKEMTISQVTADYLRVVADGLPTEDSTLPIILRSRTVNAAPGLRFEYNDDSTREARDRIDLLWDRDANARGGEDGPNGPHGYVIDRSANDGATWQSLRRADTPTELGTADTFTDSHEVIPGHKYTYRVFPVFIESGPDAYGIPALIEANSRGADLPTAARSVRAVGDGQNACLITWAAPSDPGGHPVRGYLIQMAPDKDGSPGAFVTIEVAGGTSPFTVMDGDATEFKYTGTVAQLGDGQADELSAGAMRWFRVIPVTNENDGVATTGGAILNEQGGMKTPRNNRAADGLPLMEDYTLATPAKCTTDSLGDAPGDKVTVAPKMPVDLTAEAASDTNSLAPSDRGVFLTWNMQPQGDASETTSYRIERIRMDTGVDALNDEADDWQYVTRVMDVTSVTDDTDLRQDEETRMYRVCSEASGVAEPACVDMAVDYELHQEMHDAVPPELTEPAITSADGNASGEVEVTWTPGANADGHLVMLFTDDFMSDPVVEAKSATDTTYTFTGVTNGGYVVVVVSFDTDFDFQFVFIMVSVPGGS